MLDEKFSYVSISLELLNHKLDIVYFHLYDSVQHKGSQVYFLYEISAYVFLMF